jgi:hypothetical protein
MFKFDKEKYQNINSHNDKLKVGDLFKIDKDWPDYTTFKIGNCMFNNIDDVFVTKQNIFIVLKNDQQYKIDVYSLRHKIIIYYYFRAMNVQSR